MAGIACPDDTNERPPDSPLQWWPEADRIGREQTKIPAVGPVVGPIFAPLIALQPYQIVGKI